MDSNQFKKRRSSILFLLLLCFAYIIFYKLNSTQAVTPHFYGDSKPTDLVIRLPWKRSGEVRIAYAYGGDWGVGTHNESNKDYYALDFMLNEGDPIYPIASGHVIYAGEATSGFCGYGNFVFIEHTDGYQSIYAHLKEVNVSSDVDVTTDTQIGTVGNSSCNEIPTHLHLAMRRNARLCTPPPDCSGYGPYGGIPIVPEPIIGREVYEGFGMRWKPSTGSYHFHWSGPLEAEEPQSDTIPGPPGGNWSNNATRSDSRIGVNQSVVYEIDGLPSDTKEIRFTIGYSNWSLMSDDQDKLVWRILARCWPNREQEECQWNTDRSRVSYSWNPHSDDLSSAAPWLPSGFGYVNRAYNGVSEIPVCIGFDIFDQAGNATYSPAGTLCSEIFPSNLLSPSASFINLNQYLPFITQFSILKENVFIGDKKENSPVLNSTSIIENTDQLQINENRRIIDNTNQYHITTSSILNLSNTSLSESRVLYIMPTNPEDTDPIWWLKEFSKFEKSPIKIEIHVKVETHPDFDAFRICFDGVNCQETSAPEMFYVWDTTGLPSGNHAISIQYRRLSDERNWNNALKYEERYYLSPNRSGIADCDGGDGAYLRSGDDCIRIVSDHEDLAPIGWADRSDLYVSVLGSYEVWLYDGVNFEGFSHVVRSGENNLVGGNVSSVKIESISIPPPPPPPAPIADFTAFPTKGFGLLYVDFKDQSSGEITSWLWDFGDGSTSTYQNPSKLFSKPGNYTVTLTVTGPGGKDAEIKENYLHLEAIPPEGIPVFIKETWTADNNWNPKNNFYQNEPILWVIDVWNKTSENVEIELTFNVRGPNNEYIVYWKGPVTTGPGRWSWGLRGTIPKSVTGKHKIQTDVTYLSYYTYMHRSYNVEEGIPPPTSTGEPTLNPRVTPTPIPTIIPTPTPTPIPLGSTSLISADSYGIIGNNESFDSSISKDGDLVAFTSRAGNLDPNDDNYLCSYIVDLPGDVNCLDVFIRNTNTGKTERMSITSDGKSGNSDSVNPYISADGRYVVFESWAYNFIPNDTNGFVDVFIHDRQIGETKMVSTNPYGEPGNLPSTQPSISSNGRYVAFVSRADNLVLNDYNDARDIFIKDMTTGDVQRISLSHNGEEGNNDSWRCRISDDGNSVVFVSSASNLVANDNNSSPDVFVYNRNSGIEVVSISSDGTQSNGTSSLETPSISGDGRIVVFQSEASNLVPGDTNGFLDIFIHDRQTKETRRVSISSDGTQSNGDSITFSGGGPSISSDGRFVAFVSLADNLVPGDSNNMYDAFIHDLDYGITSRISALINGIESNQDTYDIEISGNGSYVAYTSFASNLVNYDLNYFCDNDWDGEFDDNCSDVFIHKIKW